MVLVQLSLMLMQGRSNGIEKVCKQLWLGRLRGNLQRTFVVRDILPSGMKASWLSRPALGTCVPLNIVEIFHNCATRQRDK